MVELLDLHSDILGMVLSWIGDHAGVLGRTCKRLYHISVILGKHRVSMKAIMTNEKMWKWGESLGYKIDNGTSGLVLRYGTMEFLNYFNSLDQPSFSNWVMELDPAFACRLIDRNRESLKWVRKLWCCKIPNVYPDYCMENGYLDLLLNIFKKGFSVSIKGVNIALAKGHLNVLEWAKKIYNNDFWSRASVYHAFCCSDLSAAKWLYEFKPRLFKRDKVSRLVMTREKTEWVKTIELY